MLCVGCWCCRFTVLGFLGCSRKIGEAMKWHASRASENPPLSGGCMGKPQPRWAPPRLGKAFRESLLGFGLGFFDRLISCVTRITLCGCMWVCVLLKRTCLHAFPFPSLCVHTWGVVSIPDDSGCWIRCVTHLQARFVTKSCKGDTSNMSQTGRAFCRKLRHHWSFEDQTPARAGPATRGESHWLISNLAA